MKVFALTTISLLVLLLALAACGDAEEEATAVPAVPEPTQVMAAPTAMPTEAPAPTAMPTEAPAAMMTYGESPDLASMVSAGTLPPVEERLPESPLVVPVFEEIGQYGGTWNLAYGARTDRFHGSLRTSAGLLSIDTDQVTIIPQVAESYDISPDGKVFTFNLREGHRWSDGMPFTTEDVRFWWEDIILNDELWPVKPSQYRTGGELGKLEIVDDTTFSFSFSDNFRLFEEYVGMRAYGELAYQPKHYMRQFHPDYTPQADVDKLVADAGFEKWAQLFEDKHDRRNTISNAELVSLYPWSPRSRGGDQQLILERNPYYYGVDPDGNQLPYIDRVVADLVEDIDVLSLRTIAGDFDMQYRQLAMDTVPTLQKSADEQGYRVIFWAGAEGQDAGLMFNQNYDAKPAMGDLIRNLDFRIALSHAIDRDKINQLVFLGVGEGRQNVVPKGHPFYPGDEYAFKYTEFDQAKANEILDGILPEKGTDGFRLLPDGNQAVLELTAVELFGTFWPQVGELVSEMWEQVALKVDYREEERSAHYTRIRSNEQQVAIWNTGGIEHLFTYRWWTMPFGSVSRIAPLSGVWYASGGKEGVEPTGELARVIELHDKADSATPEEKIELAQEVFRMQADNLWTIGTVGNTPAVLGIAVVNNDFRNVPGNQPHQWWYIFRPEQFFFR